jgi:hypothetical protein
MDMFRGCFTFHPLNCTLFFFFKFTRTILSLIISTQYLPFFFFVVVIVVVVDTYWLPKEREETFEGRCFSKSGRGMGWRRSTRVISVAEGGMEEADCTRTLVGDKVFTTSLYGILINV